MVVHLATPKRSNARIAGHAYLGPLSGNDSDVHPVERNYRTQGLIGVRSHAEFTPAFAIDELHVDIVPDALDVAIRPSFERIDVRRSAPLFGRTLQALSRVGIDSVWRTKRNVNPTSIGFPAGYGARRKMIVRV